MAFKFDPSTRSVAVVVIYLATASPQEIGRVLAAERRGLARPEILSRFPASLGGRPPIQEVPDA
ncbi:hypothetical protein [Nocardia gipuzkoensis]